MSPDAREPDGDSAARRATDSANRSTTAGGALGETAPPAPLVPRALENRLYTRQFFQVFAAVVLFMTGVALLFHFGQYLEFRNAGVDTLGRVLSISTIGVLFVRLQIGRWIDRFGCRPCWLVGTAVAALSVGAMPWVADLWLLTVLRAIWTVALAIVMTTVAVFAAQIAPQHRRAESIGTIGLAGFLGMLIGPTLGDWVFSGDNTTIAPYRLFFGASAACSLLAGLIVLTIKIPAGPNGLRAADTRRSENRGDGPSTLRIVLRHWPGMVMLVGFVFSMAFCLQMAFLERLAEERGFRDIKVFFLVYAATGMTLRLVFRRLPERFSRRRTLVLGMTLLAFGILGLVGIDSQWRLAPAALVMGAGHCFVFPSMVDYAASRLPAEHRGTGTSLILGAGDLGMLVGFAVLGELIDTYGFDKALFALAGLVLLAALLFGFATRTPRARGAA